MTTSALTALRHELDADRPRHACALLSAEARARSIERGILGLYRWYTEHSQRRRSWHADTCVDWRSVRRDHSDAISTIVEGFFAVEQYTPDYVAPLLRLIRESVRPIAVARALGRGRGAARGPLGQLRCRVRAPQRRLDGELRGRAQKARVASAVGLAAAHRLLPGDSGACDAGQLRQSGAGRERPPLAPADASR